MSSCSSIDGYSAGAAKRTKCDPGLTFVEHHLKSYASPEKHFNKTFSFPCDKEWQLLEIQNGVQDAWAVEQLQMLKNELNEIKNELSDKDAINWHKHTSSVSISAGVIPSLKKKIKPELLTQAWCKFYEILNAYDIIRPDDNTKFATLHLCEAPGAFITALNHFLKSNPEYMPLKWQWIANSLNPYYEGTKRGSVITDDRLIRHTIENWCFGSGNTGDILSDDMLTSIKKNVGLQSIKLVTADGSIDCSKNPAEQESMVCCLHWAEVIIALSVLAPAGCLVVKMFTFYENNTVCLMYFLNCMFTKVDVFKPGTSKSGNSEVYVICTGLKSMKLKDDYLCRLTEIIFSNSGSKLAETPIYKLGDIPKDFLVLLTDCAQQFYIYQMSTIKYNLQLYNDRHVFDEYMDEIKSIQRKAEKEFLKRCNIKLISSENKIIQNQRHVTPFLNYGRSINRSCFNDKTNPLAYSQILKKQLREVNELITRNPDTSELSLLNRSADLLEICPTYGTPFEILNTSIFCRDSILNLLHQCREYGLINNGSNDKVKCNDVVVQEICQIFYCNYDKIVFKSSAQQSLEIASKMSKYLPQCQTRSEELSNSHNHGNNLNSHRVYILEMLHHQFQLRPEMKSVCLQDLAQVIQDAQKNCSVLLVVENAMSRFVAGVIYILGSLFEKISFVHSSDRGQDLLAVEFVLFHSANNLGGATSIANQLLDLSSSLQQVHDQTNGTCTVLELVPTPILLQNEKYQRFLVENNHRQLIAKLWNSIGW